MTVFSSVKWLTRVFTNVQLRTLLILPFVGSTVVLVTLVGFLSYYSGKQAVEKLADQLMIEVGDRIVQHLDSYLGKAQEINRTNVDAFESGILDLNDFNSLGKYFYRQVSSFNFAYINFGSQEGGFIGAGYALDNKNIDIAEIIKSDQSKFRFYSVDNQGNRISLVSTLKNPQFANFAWYSEAVKAGKAIWSSIYIWGGLPDRISISASTPVYDKQKKLLGVLGIDLELNQISEFLTTLHRSRSGHIFIIERSGLIVASSEDESPAPIINGKATRLKAVNSREPVIREVTEDLIQRFGSLQTISSSQSFRPNLLGQLEQKPFVKVKPYRDKYGLDWLVVTVIPESEFMSEIQANAHRTILLCVVALIISIVTGSLTANWIAKPILRLSKASQGLAQGQWQEPISENIKIAELQILATSFNRMSAQIKSSFEESETKFYTIFNTTPDPLWIASLTESRFLNVNASFCEFWGDIAENIIGKTCQELGWWENLDDFYYIKEKLNNERIIQNFQLNLHNCYNQNKTVLLSARVQLLGEENCVIGVIKDITELDEELRLRQQAESALQKSEAKFRKLAENIPGMIYQYVLHLDGTDEFTYVSPRCLNIYELEPEIVMTNAQVLWKMVHPDYLHLLKDSVENSAKELRPFLSEHLLIMPNQELKWVQASARPEKKANGDIVWDGVIIDITKNKQAEIALAESQRFIEQITYLTPNLLYIYDLMEQRNVYVNRSVGEILGYSAAEIQEMGANLFSTICHPDDLQRIYQAIQRCYDLQNHEIIETEYRVKNSQGQWRWLYSRDLVFSRSADGQVQQILGTSQDITERKQAEIALQEAEANLRQANKELQRLVNTDGLTKIANRRCFDGHLESEWQRLYREQKPLSLLLFDVDYFKKYNDCYGHQLGDECLIKIAQIVEKVLYRSADLVARYGGEEFVVILPNTDDKGAIIVANKIHAAIKNLAIPHQRSEVSDIVTISLGVSSMIPVLELSPATLVEQADQALYKAKQQGRNQSVVFYI
ncbi:MAG: diguanylate cyclase [Nostocales cyanobacterium]|nr:MAG: diguanylate cyclase [Nostocales cyanobacterium]TAF13614.1 MAG: diguanylate cyclase [Nostocales cyanobacterium]